MVFAASASFAAETPTATDEKQNALVGQMTVHRVAEKETLLDIARNYGLGYLEIVSANPGLDPWVPGTGTSVLVPTANLLPDAPREGIIINLPEQRLYFFPPDGGPTQSYAIGIGRDGLETPSGATKVIRKKAGPSWYPTPRMRREDPELPRVVGPGEDNPLGAYALYLGWDAYLIHGTNKPWGVGRRVSSGCIRLYPEDIEALFPQVKKGTRVQVVDQPVKIGWSEGELYLEVHPSLTQADQLEAEGQFDAEEIPNLVLRVASAAGLDSARVDWPAVLKAGRERSGVPIRITWSDFVNSNIDRDLLNTYGAPAKQSTPSPSTSAVRLPGPPGSEPVPPADVDAAAPVGPAEASVQADEALQQASEPAEKADLPESPTEPTDADSDMAVTIFQRGNVFSNPDAGLPRDAQANDGLDERWAPSSGNVGLAPPPSSQNQSLTEQGFTSTLFPPSPFLQGIEGNTLPPQLSEQPNPQ